MGSGASALDQHEFIDEAAFKSLAGDNFNAEIFNAFKDENGCIPKDKVIQLNHMLEKVQLLRKEFTHICKYDYFIVFETGCST